MSPAKRKTGTTLIRIIIGVALLSLAVTLWIVWNNPERKIHRRLQGLAEKVGKNGKENPIVTAKRAGEITAFFTEECTLNLGPMAPMLESRAELRGLIGQLRMNADTVGVKIRGKTVMLEPGKQRATVELMLEGTVVVSGERANEFREYKLMMKKTDKHWLIDRMDTHRSITTPDQL